MTCIWVLGGVRYQMQEGAFKDEKLLRRFLKTFKEAREKFYRRPEKAQKNGSRGKNCDQQRLK